MVTVIIGIGVMSMLQLLAAGTVSNGDAASVTTAMTLANNIRELSVGLAYYDPDQNASKPDTLVWNSKEATVALYDNVTDLDGVTDTWDRTDDPASGYQKFSPPIDGTKQQVQGSDKWAQYVKVESVDPARIRTVMPQSAKGEAVRVTVKVTRDEKLVYKMSWVVFAPLAREPVE